MLNDGGNENGKTNTQTKKNNTSHKQQQLCTCSTLLFCISLSLSCTTTAWNFLVTRFLEATSHVLTKNFVSCVPARFLFHCRSSSPYWPLKFIISIFKFDFFLFLFFCLSFALALSQLRRLCCCCCCFSLSKSSGGQDYHNIDVYHHVKLRLQPRHGKTGHFTLVTLCADGRTGGREEGRTVTWQPKFLACMNNQIFLPMVLHWRAPLYEF